jgi:hypothetical protein
MAAAGLELLAHGIAKGASLAAVLEHLHAPGDGPHESSMIAVLSTSAPVNIDTRVLSSTPSIN